jgi:predicted AAA+ superfamily ATPase
MEKMKEKVSFFIDRRKELAEIGEPGRHVVLVGYRRMGKTHLIIKHLVDTGGRKTVPVYIDMLYFASWEEFADSLVDEFLSSYDEATGKKVSSLFTRLAGSVSSALS